MHSYPQAEDDSSQASLVSHVAERIVDGVLRRRYAPGQRLIAADLANDYGVSRAPVREALHVLAGEGVVEITLNRGARIRRLTAHELVEFLEFTEAICVLGVRLATARIRDPGENARIEAAFADIEESWARRNADDFVQALYRYHIELNAISGNSFLHMFYQRPYMRFFTSLLSELAPGGNWDRYIENYRLINAAILSGDAHSAVIQFTAHIRWVLGFMRAAAAAASTA